ncbi:hypothetical protein [Pseudonocardia sp. ICBG601]|uniref:hypothetical protein n=1 Tax=Pseudonocardia sp. ICBG601 TaxID=2846759 RepID=UPI001CF70DD3|nr:hypothetical protein [Pseudonocardia sp. ICBG601]
MTARPHPPHEHSLSFCREHLSSSASPLTTVVRMVSALAGRPILLLLRLLGVEDDEHGGASGRAERREIGEPELRRLREGLLVRIDR